MTEIMTPWRIVSSVLTLALIAAVATSCPDGPRPEDIWKTRASSATAR